MRISDWSSDVCSSDLDDGHPSVREVEPPMAETGNIDTLEHNHVFLGASHDENARRTLWVVALTAVMMVGEIIAGYVTGSMALLADGFHMATHAGALSVAAVAYSYAKRSEEHPSELQSLMGNSSAGFCLKKKK